MTNDTLWDMKVLKKRLKISIHISYSFIILWDYILKILDIRISNALAFFNLRLNKVYRYNVANISPETKLSIEEVIGY